MIATKITITDEHGLHMRPASRIVETCKKFHSAVQVCRDCKKADGCSIIELLLLEAGNGNELDVFVTGEDEAQASRALSGLFEHGAGI
jgi:phosphotransferase system HPr (HPr) family protein